MQIFRRRRRRRLVRDYFLIAAVLVSGGLITSGLVELYFRYRESWEQLGLLQQEITTATAFKIEQFVQGIEHDMWATTKNRELAEKGLTPDYAFELRRLLVTARAVAEVVVLDREGVARLAVSRFRPTVPEGEWADSTSPAVQHTRQGSTYFGPVYFVQESEPYMAMAVPIERFAGELLGTLHAQVNLKYVWEVITDVRVGKAGHAYVVSRSGNLISHPDISVVLQRRNVAHLDQVKTAFQSSSGLRQATARVVDDLHGNRVVSSSALIPRLDWAVITERRLAEVYEPLYTSLLRTSGLLLIGLGIALLASLLVARRVVRPLHALRRGVEQIGTGDLRFRLRLDTGDEIELLAEEFNKMTAALQEAYTGLEDKVAARTRELARANERLQELDRMKSDFVSSVSHELRTPLTAIKGSADNMLDGMTGSLTEKQIRYLTRIRSNADRLSRLIDDILDLSRIEAGRTDLEPAQVDPVLLAQEVVESLRPVATEQSISLDVRSVESRVTAWADRDATMQVLMNLVGNALKFTPPGGVVTVAIQNGGDARVQISVTDTGPGIPREEEGKIFDKFYQVAREDTKKARGTGLGLAIAKALAEMQGGEIRVDSEPGRGSTFSFTLPASPPRR